MTIYCPSCGKPNADQADKCASCGKELEKAKPAKSSKFKGTMMMPGGAAPKPSGPAGKEPEQGGGDPEAPAPESGEDQPPAAGTPSGAAGGGGAAPPPKKNLAFQQTMLGPTAPAGTGGGAGAGSGGEAPPPAAGSDPKPRIPSPPPPSAGPPGAPSSPGSTPSPGSPEGGGAAPGPPDASGGPGSPVAGSSFGAPPEGGPGTPAPGAAGGPPAGGGGAAPGQAPPGGGGGGQGAPGQPAPAGGTGPQGSATNKKVLLWVGIGCAALLGLACIGTAIGVAFLGDKFKEAQEVQEGGQFAAEASRVPLNFALSGIQMTCQGAGPEGTADFFHPQAFPELESRACSVDDKVIDAFGNPETSQATVLEQTDYADKASDLGIDPDSCYLYEAGEAKIAGCSLDDGFKIVHMESLDAL